MQRLLNDFKQRPTDTSEKECVDVINPCVYDATKNEGPDCVEPKLVCKVVDSAINYTKREVTFKTTSTTTNANVTQVKEYQYDYDNDGKIDQKIASSALTNTVAHVYAPGKYKAAVKVVYVLTAGSKKNISQEAQCTAAVEFEKDAPFGQAKTVTNRQKISVVMPRQHLKLTGVMFWNTRSQPLILRILTERIYRSVTTLVISWTTLILITLS